MLTPNTTYTINGVRVNEKIIPDGTVWKDAAKAKAAGFYGGCAYKREEKLSRNTGKVQYVTIHNTSDLSNVNDDAEQYTRATYNENMGSARVHFYTDNTGAWQNLRAGTGMCKNDPEGSAEVSWHAGDGSTSDGGNMTSLSIEIIMNESTQADEKAKDNGARLAAWLLWKHGLSIDKLVTHTYWVSKAAGKVFADPDVQSTNMISGKKWCPTYIFGSTNTTTALKNWKAFKSLVKTYLDKLTGAQNGTAGDSDSGSTSTDFAVGDHVTYTGKVHYRGANATTAYDCVGGEAEITQIYQLGKSKHPYHLKHISKGCTVYGYVDAGTFTKVGADAPVEEPWTPAVGDKVIYSGKIHYRGANATTAYQCTGGEAEITQIYQLGKSKHPYHLKHTGKGCTVYGYVDAGTFTKA